MDVGEDIWWKIIIVEDEKMNKWREVKENELIVIEEKKVVLKKLKKNKVYMNGGEEKWIRKLKMGKREVEEVWI